MLLTADMDNFLESIAADMENFLERVAMYLFAVFPTHLAIFCVSKEYHE